MIEIESNVAGAGTTIRILDLAIDTATTSGRLTFNLFASIAQFKRENMLERQKVGIAAAKKRGAYVGRAPTARAKKALGFILFTPRVSSSRKLLTHVQSESLRYIEY
jgi:DNA invertase Pin-like site-specific DNA recombinase